MKKAFSLKLMFCKIHEILYSLDLWDTFSFWILEITGEE